MFLPQEEALPLSILEDSAHRAQIVKACSAPISLMTLARTRMRQLLGQSSLSGGRSIHPMLEDKRLSLTEKQINLLKLIDLVKGAGVK